MLLVIKTVVETPSLVLIALRRKRGQVSRRERVRGLNTTVRGEAGLLLRVVQKLGET
jgi:hypothetical protein